MKKTSYILGISAFYHDSAACLIKDGEIISAVQEERFTRKKHDSSFPENAIKFCLESNNISSKDLCIVAYYDKPFLKFERILESYLSSAPVGIKSFIKAMPIWIKQKVWIKQQIIEKLDYQGKILFPEHHESHAASAFYPSPFQESAFLTIDGVGEWATASFGIGQGNKLEILADIKFPHSLGLLYSAFTYYTGFKVNSGEYKIMGLAPYGVPKYKDLIYKYLIDVKDDGSFKMNMKYFNYIAGLTMTNGNFHDLFGGPPRKPESKLTQRDMDLTRSIQEVTEEIIIKMARYIQRKTKMNYLCLAGGVALNCVVNGKLLKEKFFDDIWIAPASGDAGGAIGCALASWYKYLGKPREADNKNDFMKGSYLGISFTDSEISNFLDERNIKFRKLGEKILPEKIADLINEGYVIGWFQGKMEFGPRALGSRSIIGDARSIKMQEIMNLKIKFRESFRPFAPSVIEERISDYFEINNSSPYMLLVANVKKKRCIEMGEDEKKLFGLEKLNVKRSEIPAVTHVDYSARIQSVSQKSNPRYYNVIKKFDEKYDCPVIVNTSFNVRGEPIVCTPEDAYLCFMRTNMDYLIMGNYLLDKREQAKLKNDSDWRKDFQLD